LPDRAIGLAVRFAGCFADRRMPEPVWHSRAHARRAARVGNRARLRRSHWPRRPRSGGANLRFVVTSDAAPPARVRARARAGIRNPSQERPFG